MSRRSILFDWRAYPVLLALIVGGIALDYFDVLNSGFIVGLALSFGYWLGQTS